MQAIELEAMIQKDGQICLPAIYKNWFGKHAKLILLETSEPISQENSAYAIFSQLPPEFSGCTEAEIIVLPIVSSSPKSTTSEKRVFAVAGTLSDDFPDYIDETNIINDSRRLL